VTAAQSKIQLIVEAVGLPRLRDFKRETKKLQAAVQDANRSLQASKGRFAGAGQSARRAGREFDNFSSSIKKAAATYLTFAAAQSAVRTGIQRIESERRIQSLASSYGEVADLANAATAATKKFGLSQTEANQSLATIYARLRPVGVSLQNIVSTYNGFNTAARLSGANAQEASSAFRQLAQALGSGALRGDEFNSISEQVPVILGAISKQTGIAEGKLREYAAEGNITAEIVIAALKSIEEDGADQLAESLNGPAQKIKDFQNAFEEVQVALTVDVIPELTKSIKEIGDLIINLQGPIRFIGQVAANTIGTINDLIDLVTKPGQVASANAIKGGRLPLDSLVSNLGFGPTRDLFKDVNTPFGKGLDGIIEESNVIAKGSGRDFNKVLLESMQKYLTALEGAEALNKQFAAGMGGLKPILPQLTGGSPEKEGDKSGKSKFEMPGFSGVGMDPGLAAEQALGKEVELLSRANELIEARIEGTTREVENRQQIASIIEQTGLTDPERIASAKQMLENIFNRKDALEDEYEASKKLEDQQKKAAQQLDAIYKGVGQTLTNGVVDSITAAIDGTKSLGEVGMGILKDLANQMLSAGIQMLLSSISGPAGSLGGFLGKIFGGGKASGGTVKGGTSYLVGEKGPELFTPGRTGSIAPNNSFGGSNVTVNVDASGTAAEGDEERSKQLGQALGAAVQAELIKQQRPGGLLAR